jgi:hypothetical protein
MLRLHPLARLARANILGDIDVLPNPEGQPANQRPRLGAPKVTPERYVVAFTQNLCPQTPTGGNAPPVGRALAPAVQQAAPHQERPACGSSRWADNGDAMPVHWIANRCSSPAYDRSKEHIHRQLLRQGPDERGRKEMIV